MGPGDAMDRGGMGGGMDMASGMQFVRQLREVLVKELPQYSEQLGDDRGLFQLLGDPNFQRAVEGALDSAPELRSQWESIQQMMSSMGGRGMGGRGGEGGRRGSGRRGGRP